jgi:ATP-dependent protease ClpP protease subunit
MSLLGGSHNSLPSNPGSRVPALCSRFNALIICSPAVLLSCCLHAVLSPCCAVSVLCRAVLCRAVLCCAVLCCAVLCCVTQLATQIVGSLLALEALDEAAPIRMYINSPGGTPYSVIGVVDAMQAVKPPIQTVALGACYSYSSLLLVSWGGQGGRGGSRMCLQFGGWGGDKEGDAMQAVALGACYSYSSLLLVRGGVKAALQHEHTYNTPLHTKDLTANMCFLCRFVQAAGTKGQRYSMSTHTTHTPHMACVCYRLLLSHIPTMHLPRLQAAGTKGQRYSMKNTRIMMTQPMGGSQGDIYAISATVKELNAIYQVSSFVFWFWRPRTVMASGGVQKRGPEARAMQGAGVDLGVHGPSCWRVLVCRVCCAIQRGRKVLSWSGGGSCCCCHRQSHTP